MSGVFVVFEGGDGVGKSTQAALLTEWLETHGREVVRTFEPGDTAVGRDIRRILLDPATGELSPRAEALLYCADKAHHVDHLVLPALERGAVVVSDRYVDSTLAYQGAGRALDGDDLERLCCWATSGLVPDLTVLLDLDPASGVGAIEAKDRLEAAGDDFHGRVRQGFLDLAVRDPDRYLVLPARRPVAELAAAVRERVAPLLSDAAGRMTT